MRSVHLAVRVPALTPEAAFSRVQDFERYPGLADAVLHVSVCGTSGVTSRSTWEVAFRNGVLRWTEADETDPQALTIAFRQAEGDFAEFSGSWSVAADADGCAVTFDCTFDFGIPSLAGVLEPIAERVLKETILQILHGLFGPVLSVKDEAPGAPTLSSLAGQH
ncbi:type II toxin-antitoxin system RatA family toxin [Streptomyces sp. NPDC053474]|uniref:type II toxin-antitoxin system RatA family toxin n=1 Tax=Streptomyces sp. NPDC053474 TaxID=3365704 RepID=UPI0037CFF00F